MIRLAAALAVVVFAGDAQAGDTVADDTVADDAVGQPSALRDDIARALANGQGRPSGKRSQDAEALAATAAEAYRDGRLDDAVDAYDRAAAVSYRDGATGRAFEFSLASAEIARARGAALEAASRFRRAALGNANDPRAAAAHHAACAAAARVVAGLRDPNELATYDQLLAEHAANWPDSPTVADTEWRRVELLAARGDWEALADRARDVPPDGERFARSRALLVVAHRGRLRDAGDAAPLVDGATNDLLPIVLGGDGRWPATWTPLRRDAALLLARTHLVGRPEGADYAVRLLRVALAGTPAPDAAWRRRGATLLAVAALAGADPSGADEALASEIASPVERRRLLAVANDDLRRNGPPVATTRLRNRLDALQPIDGATAEASGDAKIDALLAAGRRREALAELAAEAAANPNDLRSQTRYAERLAREPDRAAEALRLWRVIEARTGRGEPEWFAARLARVRLMVATDQRAAAAKLLKLTRLVAPDLGGEATRADFEALAEALR